MFVSTMSVNNLLENGLKDRKRELKISYWLLGISGFFLFSFFIVPYTLPTNSVPELSGRANYIDYMNDGSWGNIQTHDDKKVGHNQEEHGGKFVWSDLNPYSALIYGFGDLNCHQKHERTWDLNGNQMPVCVRDVGIFLGFFVGAIIWNRKGLNRWTITDSIISIYPSLLYESIYLRGRRSIAVWLFAGISIIPMGLDGGIQLISDYESNAIMRLITGIPFGLFIGLFFSASISARPKYFDGDPSKVLLPLGAKLTNENSSESE